LSATTVVSLGKNSVGQTCEATKRNHFVAFTDVLGKTSTCNLRPVNDLRATHSEGQFQNSRNPECQGGFDSGNSKLADQNPRVSIRVSRNTDGRRLMRFATAAELQWQAAQQPLAGPPVPHGSVIRTDPFADLGGVRRRGLDSVAGTSTARQDAGRAGAVAVLAMRRVVLAIEARSVSIRAVFKRRVRRHRRIPPPPGG
jgi:hypothetical protein